MPGKGKRVAARQAQLNRRRKRQGRMGTEPGVETLERENTPTTASVAAPTPATVSSEQGKAESSSAPAQSTFTATLTSGRPVASGRGAQSLAYTHLGRELRRIMILAGVLLVALFVIAFVV